MERVAAQFEIRDALTRYCRGVDRADAALIKSAFHPDAVDTHGAFSGLGWELAERLARAEAGKPGAGTHLVTNVYVEFDDDGHARCESYVLAFHPHEDGGDGARLGIFAGRYLDQFERRDGSWRIARRVVINDWSREHLPGQDWPRGSPAAGGFVAGRRSRDDAEYDLFPSPT